VIVNDSLPPSAQFVSAQTTQGALSQSNGVVTCVVGTLLSNATAQITVTVRPVIAGSIMNTATTSSDIADVLPANNSASVTTTVNAAADLSVAQNIVVNPV